MIFEKTSKKGVSKNTNKSNDTKQDNSNTKFIVEREYQGKNNFEELYKNIVDTSVKNVLCKI